ncbi:MAG: Ig-like domain-containing protein [Acidobacteriota bacterium]
MLAKKQRLGCGCTLLRALHFAIAGLLAAATGAIAQPHLIDGGDSHAVAVRADGTVWAWGENTYGQLGAGLPIPGDSCDGAASLVPVQVLTATMAPLSGAVSVAAGDDQTAAVDESGAVWMWGRSDSGQLGDGVPFGDAPPCRPWAAPVVDAVGQPLTGITAVDTGLAHTVALRNDGTAWAWGRGDNGQLGDGFGRDRPYAVQVIDGNFQPLSNLIDIAVGRRFSLALDDGGSVWAWGSDSDGQLGDDGSVFGGVSDWAIPVRRAGNQALEDIRRIAAGRDFALAVDRDGILWAWGDNRDGQLGDGTQNDRIQAVAVPLPFSESFAHLDAGNDHTYALTAAGTAWAWGSNDSAQLGGYPETSPFQSLVPVPVLDSDGDALIGLRTITATNGAGFAQADDTSVLSWGRDQNEQLGRPTPAGAGSDPNPLPVLTGDGEAFLLGTPEPDPVLTVVKQGDGDGSVTSLPGGLDCPSGCAESMAVFPQGTVLSLEVAEDLGSDFLGFGGADCQGQTCSLTLNRDALVFARFDLEPPLGVLSTQPEEDRVGVDPATDISLRFTRAVTVGPGVAAVQLGPAETDGSFPVEITADPSDATRLIVSPGADLDSGVEYRLQWPVDAAIDDEGVGLLEPFELRFSTRPNGTEFLNIAMPKPSMVEGDSQTAWVWLDRENAVDRTVQLWSDPPGAFETSAAVTIAGGAIGTAFLLTAGSVDGDRPGRLYAAEIDAGQASVDVSVVDLEPENESGFGYLSCDLLGERFNDGNHDAIFDAGETWNLGVRLSNSTGGGVSGGQLCFDALDFAPNELREPDPCAFTPFISAEDYTHLTPLQVDWDLASGTYHVRITGTAANVPGFIAYCAFDLNNGEPVDYRWDRGGAPDDQLDAGETVRIEYFSENRLENGAGEPPPVVRFWLEDEGGGIVWERRSWANPWDASWVYPLEFQVPDGPAEFTLRSEVNPLPSAIDEPNRSNNDAFPFRFTARRPNVVPVLETSLDNLSVEVEQSLELPLDFFDADGDSLSFRFLEAPDGATLQTVPPDRVVLRWTPTLEQGPNLDVDFEIEVDDGFRGVVDVPFTITVTYVTDLEVTVDALAAERGSPWTGTVTVRNRSTARARFVGVVTDLAGELSATTWACTASEGASCEPSGTGAPVDGTVELPGGGWVEYAITGDVAADATGSLALSAQLDHPPPTYTDPDPGNDSASLEIPIFDPGSLIFYDGFEDGTGCTWTEAHGVDLGCGPESGDR